MVEINTDIPTHIHTRTMSNTAFENYIQAQHASQIEEMKENAEHRYRRGWYHATTALLRALGLDSDEVNKLLVTDTALDFLSGELEEAPWALSDEAVAELKETLRSV